MVSIQCLTYNHAQYIRQCLDGFVIQKTNFRFEAIVHDDASTDGTQDIIREYEKKYPDIIKPIFEKENQYSKGIPGRITNIVNAHCKGKYIAICEGDDYWTDPLKLQKQVNIMEKYDECGFVYTGCSRYIQETGTYTSSSDRLGSFDDLLLENFIHTPTVLYRKQLKQSYDKEIFPYAQNWLMGDYPLWLYLSAISQPGFIPEITSVYRVLKESASHSHDYNKIFIFIKSIFDIRTFFAQHYHREHMLPDIAHSFVTKEVRLSLDLKHKLKENLLPYMFKYRVFDIKLGILCFLLLTSCGINIVNHIISKKCLV